MADMDPILYPIAALSVVYLVMIGFIHWKRTNSDKWQNVLRSVGIPKQTK